jgi:hypothetical protein
MQDLRTSFRLSLSLSPYPLLQTCFAGISRYACDGRGFYALVGRTVSDHRRVEDVFLCMEERSRDMSKVRRQILVTYE